MTPTPPSGWYSLKHFWLIDRTPGKTLRGPSTFLALRAAQCRWVTARTTSSWASAIGFPVSCRIIVATRPSSWVSPLLILSIRILRSFQPRSAHHAAAARADSIAAFTACSSWTGCSPTTSPVAGLRDRKRPAVSALMVVVMAITHLKEIRLLCSVRSPGGSSEDVGQGRGEAHRAEAEVLDRLDAEARRADRRREVAVQAAAGRG